MVFTQRLNSKRRTMNNINNKIVAKSRTLGNKKRGKRTKRERGKKNTERRVDWVIFLYSALLHKIMLLRPINLQFHTNNKIFCHVIGWRTVAILNNNKTHNFNKVRETTVTERKEQTIQAAIVERDKYSVYVCVWLRER